MFNDFKELLSIFHARGVKYLIVGGYAVSFHAQPWATKDLDLLVEPGLENSHALYEALRNLAHLSNAAAIREATKSPQG